MNSEGYVELTWVSQTPEEEEEDLEMGLRNAYTRLDRLDLVPEFQKSINLDISLGLQQRLYTLSVLADEYKAIYVAPTVPC